MNSLRFPTEWREVSNLATELTALDSENDYRLPTRSQWSFACKNGYDRTWPGRGAKSIVDSTASNRPNKYGIDDFMNYDAECADKPGLVLGNGSNSECRCDQFSVGNPDGEDSVNELIAARFVLVPKSPSQ